MPQWFPEQPRGMAEPGGGVLVGESQQDPFLVSPFSSYPHSRSQVRGRQKRGEGCVSLTQQPHLSFPFFTSGFRYFSTWSAEWISVDNAERTWMVSVLFIFFFIPKVLDHESIQASSPLVSRHLLSIYYVPSLMLGTRDTELWSDVAAAPVTLTF